MSTDDAVFARAVQGLRRGDFSALAPLVQTASNTASQMAVWVNSGRFKDLADVLAEVLSCASFLGCTELMSVVLEQGVDPNGGSGTGLNALHWAVNRGQADAVELLLDHGASMDVRNMYGGDVLATAIWSATHEPKPSHAAIIETLLQAGARPESYSTGVAHIDELLTRYGPRSNPDGQDA